MKVVDGYKRCNRWSEKERRRRGEMQRMAGRKRRDIIIITARATPRQ